MLPLSVAALAYVILVFTLAASLVWTVVGLIVPGIVLLGARGWGTMYRALAARLLDTRIDRPAPYVRPRGFWRAFGALFADADAWRALLFMFLTFPLSLAATVINASVLATALQAITYPLWRNYLPAQQAGDGTWQRGSQWGSDYFIDTPGRMALQALAGVGLLLLWPWLVRGFGQLFRLLSSSLLGPTRTGERVAALRATRAAAVRDADARLRTIERDLHDGPQARLVAVAMQLGEARVHLASGSHLDEASALVDSAHAATKETLVELREIVRGIHPPALDAGLGVALTTLAAGAAIPVAVKVDPALDEAGAVEPPLQSLVYYCVAELLANVAKHSGATAATVAVKFDAHGDLHVEVGDNGKGGATVVEPDGSGLRTGLNGLFSRVGAVDGSLVVNSPQGGPTVVTVTVPMANAS
jgi:signal transduction histidine kinase